jgi:hypothetical protein
MAIAMPKRVKISGSVFFSHFKNGRQDVLFRLVKGPVTSFHDLCGNF